MNDYRLQFADEAAWWAAAASEGWVQHEYAPQTVELDQEPPEPVIVRSWIAAPGIDFDEIGIIYRPTGNVIDQDGIEVPEMEPMPGWHVNIRILVGLIPDNMISNVVLPANPVRTFAGGWFQGPV
jgi:hypothetical protein